MIKPYYQDDWVTLYLGDCRAILPQLDVKVDLVLTDPPYESQHPEYGDSDISFLKDFNCRQLIFWSARDDFPLDYSAIHIWDKYTGTITVYERIFERNGKTAYRVYRAQKIQNHITAQINRDVVTSHPSQKPRKLVEQLVAGYSEEGNLILDPFLGSGTTAYCAKKLNRKCIGIEINEDYCHIAAKRLSQQVFDFGSTV